MPQKQTKSSSYLTKLRLPGEEVDVESLISMTNKARAEAMIAEAVSGRWGLWVSEKALGADQHLHPTI